MRADCKRLLFFLLKAGLVAGLLAWLVHSRALDLRYFHVAVGGLPWLLLGVLCIAASICLTGTRYWLILRQNGIEPPLAYALRVEFIGTFFNLCSLGPLGGDVARLYYMARFSGSGPTAAGATAADRMVGLLALLLLILAALSVAGPEYLEEPALRQAVGVIIGVVAVGVGLVVLGLARVRVGRPVALGLGLGAAGLAAGWAVIGGEGVRVFAWGVAAGLACAAAGVGCLGGENAQRLLRSLERRGKWGQHLGEILRAAAGGVGGLRSMTGLLLLALVQQASYVLAMLCLAWAMSLPVRPAAASIFLATPLTFVLGVLPLPGAGLGVNEAAFDFLLTLAAPGLAGGASLYLFFRAWLIAVSTAGIPFYLTSRKGLKTPLS